MTFFQFNKIIGALLGAVLFALFLGLFSDILVTSPAPKVMGWDLPTGAAPAKAATAAVAEPLPVLLAKADPAKGKALTKICATCHSFDKGGAAKVGPGLYGVVGRAKASFAGFGYSDGLKAKGGDWTFEDINAFVTNPKAFIAGTKMGYAGEPDAAKRADLIAYLNSNSDKPLPLPAAK